MSETTTKVKPSTEQSKDEGKSCSTDKVQKSGSCGSSSGEHKGGKQGSCG